MDSTVEKGARLLFQGDSITDAGRDRTLDASLGDGYVSRIAAALDALFPDLGCTVLNRGVGGNRVYDLEQRWQTDTLDLRPDVLTLMIGINDTWRAFDSADPSPIDGYEASLRRLVEPLTCKVVLMEPFVLPVPEDRRRWRVDLDPRINVVRRVASDNGSILLPLDGLFAAAAADGRPQDWADDGVHPSPRGHALIARAWLRAVQLLPW